MLPVDEAEKRILQLIQPLQAQETIPLASAGDRILAQTVTSQLDFPYWDNSAMDGYAVKFEDVQHCHRDQPCRLKIIEEIPAGYCPQQKIESGDSARIFTGGMLPEGADTVVMQEQTQRDGDKVMILTPPKLKQAFVRQKGTYYQKGNPLLKPGVRITAAEIAILATAQLSEIEVFPAPKVGILSTGDELVLPDQVLRPGQIVDSNQFALATAVATTGGMPQRLGIVPDDPQQLRQKIAQAIATSDMVLSTGGVSVGDYDYIDQILAELGGEIHIRSVAIKPGKPLTVASFANGCVYFGIPGNPVSALVSWWRFVKPALLKLSGLNQGWLPRFIGARTAHDLRSGGKRETYLWGRVESDRNEFSLAGGSHSSGNLINLAQTNALARIPVGQTLIPAGDQTQVMLLS